MAELSPYTLFPEATGTKFVSMFCKKGHLFAYLSQILKDKLDNRSCSFYVINHRCAECDG